MFVTGSVTSNKARGNSKICTLWKVLGKGLGPGKPWKKSQRIGVVLWNFTIKACGLQQQVKVLGLLNPYDVCSVLSVLADIQQ